MTLFHKAFYGFMFYAGMRTIEVLRVKLDNLNIHSKTLFIIGAKARERRYERIITIPDLFIPILKKYLMLFEPKEYLFEKRHGEPYTSRSNLIDHIKKYAQHAGLYNWQLITCHILRHSYATNIVEKYPGEVEQLSAMLGHRSIDTTRNRYIHYSHETKRKIVNATFPVKGAENSSPSSLEQADVKYLLAMLLKEVREINEKDKIKPNHNI